MKSLLKSLCLVILLTASLVKARQFQETSGSRSSQVPLILKDNLLQLPNKPKEIKPKEEVIKFNPELLKPQNPGKKNFQLVPKNRQLLQGPDLTAGANPIEQSINELVLILTNALIKISPDSYSFLITTQWVVVPENTTVQGLPLKSVGFAGLPESISFNLDESQSLVFFHMDILKQASSVINLKSNLYSELIDLVVFLSSQMNSSKNDLTRDDLNSQSQSIRLRLFEFIKVPAFFDWKNTTVLVSPDSGCRNQIRLGVNPYSGVVNLAYNSTGDCPPFLVEEPIRDISPLKFFQGFEEYQCLSESNGIVSCLPRVNSDFACTLNIWNRIPDNQKPRLTIMPNQKVEIRYFLCELQKTKVSAKLPLTVIYERIQ
ncbi:MAG: hypothetical protein ACK5W9_13945 [Bdellovibrionales bacterium]